MGSVRAQRLGPVLVRWVAEIGQEATGLPFELVDLAEWKLPMDDEPHIPVTGRYLHPHTRAWSEKVAGGAGFVFVTPQYNWGNPAALKNAIDHCYAEWQGKPLAIVTYGGHGGAKCAEQLQQVAEGIKMRLVPAMPGLSLTRAMMDGGPINPEADFAEQWPAIHAACVALAALLSAG